MITVHVRNGIFMMTNGDTSVACPEQFAKKVVGNVKRTGMDVNDTSFMIQVLCHEVLHQIFAQSRSN